MRNSGFIDRSPLSFLAGIFMLIVAFLTGSIPLGGLGFFDLGVGFVSFFNPDVADKKSAKLIVLTVYGFLIFWSILWLMSKLS